MPHQRIRIRPVQTPITVYEQPLGERLRFFLRLECLFSQTRHCLRSESERDSHTCLGNLLEILHVIGRVDIKTEVLKELERIIATLEPLAQTPGVNHDTLDSLLVTLGGFKSHLYNLDGPIAQELRDNEFFKLLLQRSGIPGGLCDFDLPPYRHWLQRDADTRIADLRHWYGSLDTLRLSVDLILKLIRESATPVDRTAEGGLYQQGLDSATPFQLIRVSLPGDSPYFVEISGGRHRFTVRLLQASTGERAQQATADIPFQLSCCAL